MLDVVDWAVYLLEVDIDEDVAASVSAPGLGGCHVVGVCPTECRVEVWWGSTASKSQRLGILSCHEAEREAGVPGTLTAVSAIVAAVPEVETVVGVGWSHRRSAGQLVWAH